MQQVQSSGKSAISVINILPSLAKLIVLINFLFFSLSEYINFNYQRTCSSLIVFLFQTKWSNINKRTDPLSSKYVEKEIDRAVRTRGRSTYGQCIPVGNEQQCGIPERSPVPKPPGPFAFPLVNDA